MKFHYRNSSSFYPSIQTLKPLSLSPQSGWFIHAYLSKGSSLQGEPPKHFFGVGSGFAVHILFQINNLVKRKHQIYKLFKLSFQTYPSSFPKILESDSAQISDGLQSTRITFIEG